MIAYQDLVVALKSWRARNGLPDTPPDFGAPVPTYTVTPQASAPDEIYDLSDDSGLIVADDLVATQAADEFGDEIAEQPYDADHDPYAEPALGAIETGVEVSAESAMPAPDDYDNPPGTDAYSDYSPAELDPYGAQSADAYGEQSADAYGEQADAYGEQSADAYGEQSADAYGEQSADAYGEQQAYTEPAPLAEPEPLAEPDYGAADAYGDDEEYEGATVVGGDEYAPPAAEGTLEADAADVVDEVALDAAADEEAAGQDFEEIGAEGILDEEPVSYTTMDDDVPEEATVISEAMGQPGEPEALPEPPDDPDRDY